MKHTTVEVDETLLDEARKVTLEESPSAIVAKALEELVRIAELKRGIKAMRETDDLFWPNYLEEIRPNSTAAYEKRLASYEGREPREVGFGRRTD